MEAENRVLSDFSVGTLEGEELKLKQLKQSEKNRLGMGVRITTPPAVVSTLSFRRI